MNRGSGSFLLIVPPLSQTRKTQRKRARTGTKPPVRALFSFFPLGAVLPAGGAATATTAAALPPDLTADLADHIPDRPHRQGRDGPIDDVFHSIPFSEQEGPHLMDHQRPQIGRADLPQNGANGKKEHQSQLLSFENRKR